MRFQGTIIFSIILLICVSKIKSEGIVVTGKKSPIESKKLNQEEISKVPGTFGEPLRAIETLPGVGITSFLLGEFSIRGASPNANNIYIDNLPVGYIFHTIGIHSVIHRSMIQSLNLETGVYSAKYQNAIGGVIQIETPDKLIKREVGLETSLFSLSGSWTAASDDLQDYIIVGGRVATLNKSYGQIPAIAREFSFPDYANTQIKAKKRLNANHSLYYYTFFARDTYRINIPTENEEENGNPILSGGNFDYGRSFFTGALRWEYERGNLKNQVSAIYFTRYNSTTVGLVNLDIDTMENFRTVGVRQDADFIDTFKNKWEFGVEIQSILSSIGGINSTTNRSRSLLPDPMSIFESEFTIQELNRKRKDTYASGYLQSKITTQFGLWTPGLRYENYLDSGTSSLTPRIRWDRTNDPREWNLFFKAGSMSRYPSEPLSVPGHLEFEKADSGSLGIIYPWMRLWFLQLEPFYVNYRDLIIRNNSVSSEFQNSELGISRGVEFIIKKNSSFNSGYYGWLSYTYSENKRRFKNNGSDWIESDFDLRHNMNLVFGYKINPEWSIGLRWFIRSSFPYTPIIGDDGGINRNQFTNQRIFYPIFSPYENTSRLPSIHRLDLRIDRNIYYEWGMLNFYIEAINLYGRNNFVDSSWNPAGDTSSGLNPSPSLDATTFRLQNPGITLPLINFGLEVRF